MNVEVRDEENLKRRIEAEKFLIATGKAVPTRPIWPFYVSLKEHAAWAHVDDIEEAYRIYGVK